MALQHDDHYVPRLYLKGFASSPGLVWTYRTLAAHPRAPEWQEKSIKGIGYLDHLYTRTIAGIESDEIEKWLNTEFESPAKEALLKATQDRRLSQADWHNLVRFLAAQDVRTPARLIERMEHWHESLTTVLTNTLKESIHELEQAKKSGQVIDIAKTPNSDLIPLRITREIESGQEHGILKTEVLAGRSLWFFEMRHVLTNTIKVLQDQKWTILVPPDGLAWFTSDDPVLRLNYHSDETYDFKGGWGSIGTEIFLPLDPGHLMYAQIGKRPPQRGSAASQYFAKMTRRFVAEHAHRFIFAMSPDTDVPRLRPRIVDASRVREEHEQWRRWPKDQTTAEREMAGPQSVREEKHA
jgi:hypothetical protein